MHNYSRFFRDAFGQEFYLRKLAKQGVKLVSITQPLGDDDDPAQAMMRKVKGGTYRYYYCCCSRRLKEGTMACEGIRMPMGKLDDIVLGEVTNCMTVSPAQRRSLQTRALARGD